MLSITTWNVNSIKQRAEHAKLLCSDELTVLCLQELKCKTEDYPEFCDGYQHFVHGQKAYNGVAVATNVDNSSLIETGFRNDPQPEQSRAIAVQVEDIQILNLYVPNGSSLSSDKYQYKLKWLDALIDHIENKYSSDEPVLICGDFNIAPEEIDTHDPEKWKDCVLVSDEERERFNKLIELGYIDLFREMYSFDKSFSWWDYRAGSFERNAGLRIDLMLATESLAERCTEIEILKEFRQKDKPSDHAPVRAFFEI